MKLTIRLWILIFALILAFLSIAPWKYFDDGVLVTSVEPNSTTFSEGLRQGQIINSVNGEEINSIEDYSNSINKLFPTVEKTKITIGTDEGESILFANTPPEIVVSSMPKSRIKTGLDLSGGSKALVKAKDRDLSSEELSDLISITSNRINVYGISDIQISPVTDLSGNNYMSIEIAGATPKDLEDLLSQQGKFEAKIGNDTVFIGGDKDIQDICRNDATCSGIRSCNQASDGTYFCTFDFTIYLSSESAQRHAEVTGKLETDPLNPGYLSKKLDLYLDDRLVDSLLISQGLKGSATTQIQIQGSGQGATNEDAFKDAETSMKHLQTILITGSLPYQLEIVKLDTISPSLGKEFLENIIVLGLTVFIIISVILFIKYRKVKITLAVILTMFSEAFITLGVAALFSWNLDAPAIAGIIAGMGTGVNDQIIIIDEAVSSGSEGIKQRIKRALFIIFGAFFTIVAAMLPLLWAGAGLLKGFALTTILSVSVGILVTRPAFADMIKKSSEQQ